MGQLENIFKNIELNHGTLRRVFGVVPVAVNKRKKSASSWVFFFFDFEDGRGGQCVL